MKRELEPSVDDQSDEKKARNSEPEEIDADDINNSFFPLLDLPNDEFKLILRHLPIEDRFNLKVTCKTAERRLMVLDSSMRKWHLHPTDDHYKEMKISLSKARLKHIKDGDLHEINISLIIDYSKRASNNPFVLLILAENLIKEWKNNIVSLRLSISGVEYYLLDPEIKMPRLKALILFESGHSVETVRNTNTRSSYDVYDNDANFVYDNGDSSVSDNSSSSDDENNEGDNQMVGSKSDRIKIASFLIQNHEDTMQELHLDEFDVTISPGLKLTKFTANKVDTKTVESVLNFSSSSLVVLGLGNILEKDDQLIALSQRLSCLKEFKATVVNSSIVGLIVRSSNENLENLVLKQHNIPKPNTAAVSYELGSTVLKIKTFNTNIESEDLLEFLKASQKSLEDLRIDGPIHHSLAVYHTSLNLNGVELNLKKLTASRVSSKVIASLLKSSSKSLKVLNFSVVDGRFDYNFTQSCRQLQVEKMLANCVSPSILAYIISVSNESLEVLKIRYNDRSSLINEVDAQFHLQCQSLKVKEFAALCTPSNIIEAVIKASHESLEDLSMSLPNPTPSNNDTLDLDGIELKLIRFRLAGFSNKPLGPVLRSSFKTLQDLELEASSYILYKYEFRPCSNMKLQLKRFVADGISAEFVGSILCMSNLTLEELTMNRVRSQNEDYKLNTQLKQLKKFTAISSDSRIFFSVLRSSQATLEVLDLQEMAMKNCRFDINLNLKRFVGEGIEAHMASLIISSSISSLEYLYLTYTYEMMFLKINVIEVSLSGREGFEDSNHHKDHRLNNIKILETTDQQYQGNNPATKMLFTEIRKLLLEPAVFHRCVIEKDGKGRRRHTRHSLEFDLFT